MQVAYKLLDMSQEALQIGVTLQLNPLDCNSSIETSNQIVSLCCAANLLCFTNVTHAYFVWSVSLLAPIHGVIND